VYEQDTIKVATLNLAKIKIDGFKVKFLLRWQSQFYVIFVYDGNKKGD